jgi:hypothetical protein
MQLHNNDNNKDDINNNGDDSSFCSSADSSISGASGWWEFNHNFVAAYVSPTLRSFSKFEISSGLLSTDDDASTVDFFDLTQVDEASSVIDLLSEDSSTDTDNSTNARLVLNCILLL